MEHAFVVKQPSESQLGRKVNQARNSSGRVPAGRRIRTVGDQMVRRQDLPFAEVGWHEPRSWVMGEGRVCESWRVKMGDGTLRDIYHHGSSWYVVHDPEIDRPDEGWSP